MITAVAHSATHGVHLSATVVAAIVAAAVSLVALATNTIVTGRREQRNRRRDAYSSAFAAVCAYKEFPYAVRRRRADPDSVADERVRISEQLRLIQHDLSYHQAWLKTESPAVAAAYARLVQQTRRVAGRQIHQAWLEAPIVSDAQMNMPDLGLTELIVEEDRYLTVAAAQLSLKPTLRRREPKTGA